METLRLWLRPLAWTDLDNLARIYSNPEVMRYRLISQAATREQTKEMLESYLAHWSQHGFGRWAAIHKVSQKLIGHCGLEYLTDENVVEVSYLLDQEYWGQGLATESASVLLKYGFETLQFERLVALAHPQNLRSRRVIEKIGMQYEQNVQLYGVSWEFYTISLDQWKSIAPQA